MDDNKQEHTSQTVNNNDITQDSQILGDNLMLYIHISLNIILRMLISLVGVVTNFINLIILTKLGFKDSMSVGLGALSFTDFLVTLTQLGSSVCYIIDFLFPESSVDFWMLGYFVFGWAISGTYLMSCWITAMISIERCLCVVSPFKVKQIFTRSRCVALILIIYMANIAIISPTYALNKIGWIYIWPKANIRNATEAVACVFTVVFGQQTATYEKVFDLAVGVTMSFLLQAVMVVCAVWMGYSLEASSKIRVQSSSVLSEHSIQSPWAKWTPTLSTREQRLIKVVLSLAVILTVCHVPDLITVVVYHTLPGLTSGQQRNLNTTLWSLTSVFGSLGCSCSFFVYIALNTKFQRLLWQSCGCHYVSRITKLQASEVHY